MSVPKKTVQLFYDVLSPYACIAFHVLTRMSEQWTKMDLQLKPALIAGIMQSTGNQPPGMLPARASYMTKDLYRLAEYYDVKFKFPTDVMNVMIVKGSMKAQRLLTAVKQECPEHLVNVSTQLYSRIYFNDQDITEDSSLREACLAANLSDETANKLVAMTSDPEIKEALKKTTNEAVSYGAFGLPSYVVEHNGKPQLLFGTDRLFLLAHYLDEKMPGSRL
ncbi:glutathione S-transferase kappa 1-like [Styela clava]